ncbi:hypothetical protein [Dyadobacter tibetensis]|uniref:hypothetical protein n=1 Tax=Dyadobacter tibetensis TaxID=1211851 RepID=UPI0004719F9D|nr:hypothetical protein [Dyadobacter tibetensis]
MKDKSDKKDRLERFVRDNREDFDRLEPSEALWDKITQSLPAQENKNGGKVIKGFFNWNNTGLKVAAVVVLAIGVGMLVYLNQEYGLSEHPAVAISQPSYAKEVSQYTRLIDRKRDEIIKLTSDNPELRTAFKADLEALEMSYRSLRTEIGHAPNQEAMLEAMIQNLQWQIDLLNQQLDILKRFNKTQDDHNKIDNRAAVS